jgi:hypothetical protein
MNAFRTIRPLRLRRPRYADVAATVALLLSMGGTAYAATALAPNTVGTPQLKDHAVTAIKLHAGAVTPANLAAGAVTDVGLADAAVTNTKLADGAVTNTKIADGAVTNFKIAPGSVTHSKLGADSIDGSNVAANSLSLADMVGADISGGISFSLGAGKCGSLALGVSGAQVGQVVLFSFKGDVAVPSSVTFGGTKVTSAGHVTVFACNHAASTVSVTNLGIRVITFG